MAKFSVVFLNCFNLFEMGLHRNRGPQTAQALTGKIDLLAATIRPPLGAELPDIVCLCEVGGEALGKRLADTIAPAFYQTLWSGTPDWTQTGLMIFYNVNALQITASADDTVTRGVGERCKWIAAQFVLRNGTHARFWLVLNHWKSQRGGEARTEPSRSNSAAEIGQFFLQRARIDTEAMLIIGDFNCEPGALPFHRPNNNFRSVREHALVLRDRNRLAYFYNPMWRLLGEADDYDTTRQISYTAPRPPGTTYVKSQGWRTFDQIMVSKTMLTNGFVRFLESSLCIVEPQVHCSDHCAITAEFEYV